MLNIMAEHRQEREIKYYVSDLARIASHLEEMGARLVQPRVLEVNLRFDTRDSDLSKAHRLIRLRQDTAAHLTYKGPSRWESGVRARQEIEFTVSDFEGARLFLEALDYQVVLKYEKYRAVYAVQGVHVTLDELPYGFFVELEGESPAAILELSDRLGLNWAARVSESYTALFERLSTDLRLSFRDLSFENFRDLKITSADLAVRAADEHD
jgi:adenylate cyclase class 2